MERTEINIINNIVESGFGINGTKFQLFSFFKNNKHFCISEERQEICQICNNKKCFRPTAYITFSSYNNRRKWVKFKKYRNEFTIYLSI